jgi:hypothetical protein
MPPAAEKDAVEGNAPDLTGPPEAEEDAVEAIYRAWDSDFYDSPLHDLRSLIDKYKRKDVREVYGKTIVFVQSSGMGKSRLAKEYGIHICPMISYCLRRKGECSDLI